MFKNNNFKIFRCNPNDPNFDLSKFVGKIYLYILKCSDKTKRIKTICKKCFTKLQKMKNTQSKIKTIKIGKRPGTT